MKNKGFTTQEDAMERERKPRIEVCSDCDGVSRRDFLRTVGVAAGAAVAAGTVLTGTAGTGLSALHQRETWSLSGWNSVRRL